MLQRVYYQLFKRHVFALTGPIGSLPDFIIISTARSRTTSLYYNICQHSCIIPAAFELLFNLIRKKFDWNE